jgi:Tfp pilus assembly protein PilW
MELTVVTALAGIVLLGIVGFYLNSQATWMEGSAQAVTQRETTVLMEKMTRDIHRAGDAQLLVSPPGLQLFDAPSGTEIVRYWFEPTDSLIHEGHGALDHGEVVGSRAERFDITIENGRLVRVTSLVLRSAEGDRVATSFTALLYNAP